MRFKPDRAHYIRPDMIERRDDQSTAVAYLSGDATRPCAMLFSAKRQKPDANYRYRTEERREAAILEHFESVRRREAWQGEQRAQRKAVTAKNAALDFAEQTYLSAAAVAALLRQCLKEAFPGQRFSVTSDGSIRVRWTDGPSRRQVERIAKAFEGSYFDGMIDYRGSIYHSLDGRKVSFGADFVFCERDMSRAALESGAALLRGEYASALDPATFEPYSHGEGFRVAANPDFPAACESGRMHGETDLKGPDSDDWETGRFHSAARALELWFDKALNCTAKPSPTFDRVKVLGSDGYGNTALEAADGGETGRGYPRRQEDAEAVRARDAIERAGREAAEVLAKIAAEPRAVECEVIDLAPHLAAHIARADAARRVN